MFALFAAKKQETIEEHKSLIDVTFIRRAWLFMVRPKGSLNKTEPKNRAVRLRLTAREYAQTILVARYTNHSINDILRKFVNDGLIQHKEMLKQVNRSTINDIAKRYFRGSSSSSSRSRRWARGLDRSDIKKPFEELEVNPLTDSPPIVIEDHDINQVLGFYELELKKKVKKNEC